MRTLAGSSNLPRMALDIHGFGKVGQAFLPMAERAGFAIRHVWNSQESLLVRATDGRPVFIDATAPRYDGPEAEAWIRVIEKTLTESTPVITCNKAPLALAWTRLRRAAERGRTTLSCSATVGGGTPVLSFLRQLERSHGVDRVDAAVNGTLSFVFGRVSEGQGLVEAVDEARAAGFAEPDASLDLDGTDSLAKGLIIHNLLYPDEPAKTLSPTRRRLTLSEGQIRELSEERGFPQAIVSITRGAVDLSLRAGVLGSPTGSGASVTVRAQLSSGSNAVLAGPGAGPSAAAGALLADLVDLEEREGGGIRGILPW